MAQLGNPGRSFRASSAVPLAVPNLTAVADLAAGLNHTCARLASGSYACWGWDEECQLGVRSTERCIGGTPCLAAPTPFPALDGAVELELSAMHSCARRSDGSVACWGDDLQSFHPDNTGPYGAVRCEPAVIGSLHGALQIAVFWTGVCALDRTGTVACLGSNMFGQLADGTTHARGDAAPIHR